MILDQKIWTFVTTLISTKQDDGKNEDDIYEKIKKEIWKNMIWVPPLTGRFLHFFSIIVPNIIIFF